MQRSYLFQRLFAVHLFSLFFFIARSQCTADFNFQQDLCSPNTVVFSTTLTGIQSFSWDFGNNTTSTTDLNPVISYASFGTFIVSLTVTYTTGCTYTKTKSVPVQVQNDNSLITTTAGTICMGDSVQLQSAGSATDFCWHTAAGFVNNSSQSIYVNPANPTTYYYTTQATGGNIATNGDFSAGNSGFSTNYNYCNYSQCISEGGYVIGNDPQFFHVDFRANDHTTGTGNLMMVNGALNANVPVWCQNVTITPNTDYTFSMWICTMAGEYAPAQLQFNINGLPVGSVATAPSTIYTWVQHVVSWNSGSASSASICIISTSDWFGGNDFGLDDITFSTPSTGIRTDSVSINVQPLPVVDAGSNPSVCRGNSAQLHAVTNASNITWTPAQYLNNAAVTDPGVINLPVTTTFYIDAGNGNCIKRDSVTVFVLDKPSAAISPANSICAGASVMLNAQAGNATSYAWTPSTGLSDPASLNTSASPDSTTIYTFIATNTSCADTAKIEVKVNNSPRITLNKSNDIDCSRNTVTLTAAGATEYLWEPDDFITDNNNSGQITVKPEQSITYYVEGKDNNGCKGKDSIKVNFNKTGTGMVFVPNAFTPNGDNRNDVFKPLLTGIPRKYEFRVFNRWGELVFFSDNPARGWDGSYKSKQAGGVYAYWIKTDSDCGSEFIKGTVILIK